MDSDTKRYLEEYGLNRLFKDMLTCLLEDRPTDPISYMMQGLERVKNVPAHPRPVSFIRYFHDTDNRPDDKPDEDCGAELDLDSLKQLSMADEEPLPGDFCSARRQSVSAESYQPRLSDKPDNGQQRVVIPKSPDSRGRIENAVRNNLLFRNLDADQREQILDAMFERRASAGETIIRQGDPGDNFYAIESGRYQVIVNGEERDVMEAGKTFGELALMYNCPRSATIVCIEPGVLWAVDRKTFSRTVIDLAYRKRKMYEGFLRSVSILSSLTDIEISRIADALEPVGFKEGQVVIREGELGEDFYIIVSGEAVISQGGKEVNRLRSGDYFGERALMEHIPRTATVTAVSDLKCVVLTESAFQRLLGPLKDLMQRNQERYAQSVH